MDENIKYLRAESLRNTLSSFFYQLWCFYHKKTESFDFEFWSQCLDKDGIPWSVQNIIAEAAEVYENQSIYFRTLLQRLNIDLLELVK